MAATPDLSWRRDKTISESGYEISSLEEVEAVLDGMENPTSADVWHETLPYSDRAVASVAAARAGSGSAAVANYAVIEIDGGPGVGGDPPLSVANPAFDYPASALSILEQSGSDFSIGTDDFGHGAVLSAAGGLMQAGLIADPGYAAATLDGGNTDPRWVQLGFNVGDGSSVANSLGYDCSFQVGGGASGHQTFAGLPGIVIPGGPAVRQIRFLFQNPFGTDSVVCDFWDAEAIIVWTIAPLT